MADNNSISDPTDELDTIGSNDELHQADDDGVITLSKEEIINEATPIVENEDFLESEDNGESQPEDESSSVLRDRPAAPPRRERLRSHYGDHFDRQLRAFEHTARTPEGKERQSRLYSCLNGSIQFLLSGSKDRFYISGSGSGIQVKDGVIDKADCTISISPKDLQGIIDGQLNAQVALISDKVKVEGNTGLAIYAFNLVHL
jgi:putative sterol carrier protein